MFSLFNWSNKTEFNGSTPSGLKHEKFFEELRAQEFQRLDDERQVYLDYTGGNLHSISQLRKHTELLTRNVLGNPHSTNPTSLLATNLVDEAREKVKSFFNADDYVCIFTPNATGALKIIGECYPFNKESHLLLLADNHNSVNGIREYCRKNGGSFSYSPLVIEDLELDHLKLEENLSRFENIERKLFAFPGQSNASGVKHDLKWIKKAADNGWDVLLDAAAYSPTNKLDLKEVSPDFVSISFYKIFGFPTGLGCLLVKKSKFELLNKQWFAGGTISIVSVNHPGHFLLNAHERFENGTINYLDIPAIKTGLDFIESIGMTRINERVNSLIQYLYDELNKLKHDTGVAQLNLLGPANRSRTGGNLIMTFNNPDGSLIPFDLIESKANEMKISIRSGCFCNPGIDEANHCITSNELESYFTSRDKGDYYELTHHLNRLRGSTRASVGIPTTKRDIDSYIKFVRSLKDKTFVREESVLV